MHSLVSDVRHAVRRLIKSPAFTATALLTLALAVGANTAIFSVVDALMLRPLPYRDASRLTELAALTPDGLSNPYFPPAQIDDWREHRDIFSGVEAFSNYAATIA